MPSPEAIAWREMPAHCPSCGAELDGEVVIAFWLSSRADPGLRCQDCHQEVPITDLSEVGRD